MEENKDMRGNPPSFADIAAAMKVLQQPPPPPAPEPQGVNKHIPMIVVAAVIGIGAWTLNSLNTVQQAVTSMAATMTAMGESVKTMSTRSDAMVSSLADTKTSLARMDQRVSQNEQRISALESRGAPTNGSVQTNARANGVGQTNDTGGF